MPEMILADGTRIDTTNGKRTISTDINKVYQDQDNDSPVGKQKELVTGRRRYLDDLPMPFLQSKPVAIIASYTMFGLTAGDMSRVLGIQVQHIIDIQNSPDFTTYMDGVLQNVREYDADKVRKILNKNAKRAAKNIVEMSNTSESEKIRLEASKDILNRTGHKPADVHEHRMEGGFTIRHIKDTAVPTSIDVEIEDA